MIMLAGLVVVGVSVPLLGGRLSRLGDVRFRSGWLVAVAILAQAVVIGADTEVIPATVSAAVHLLSYAVLIVFIWRNRRLRGLAVIVLGGALNLIAIGANGGVMPASARAVERAGIDHGNGEFSNSAPVENPRFAALGDIFAIPEGVPGANVFSVGDVILVIGAAVFLHSACGSRLARCAHDDSAESVADRPAHATSGLVRPRALGRASRAS